MTPCAEGRTERPVVASTEINAVTAGDDPRWKQALTRFANAQAAVDRAHRSDDVPHRERALAYQIRAEAFNELARTAPLDTVMPFIRACFAAAMADGEAAREYERRANRAGDGR